MTPAFSENKNPHQLHIIQFILLDTDYSSFNDFIPRVYLAFVVEITHKLDFSQFIQRYGLNSCGSRIVAGNCENSNETSVCMTGEQCLAQLKDCSLSRSNFLHGVSEIKTRIM
jgi:hypothetical protein